ncbi:hypothetical protein [Rhizobium setariae]|uniref:hypothetical protein n=1 Tax=Rhizobium setariae TaxID=2801340 RepID=UPI0019192004|nr:hypothetical protein [Rhizobium setariae]
MALNPVEVGRSRRAANLFDRNASPLVPGEASDPLNKRENALRLGGEFVQFCGLMALLVGLLLYRQISGFDNLRDGAIHLPHLLAGAYSFTKPRLEYQVLADFYNMPAGNGLFTAMLCSRP